MGFLGVYKAIYDYEPQSEEELAIVEGDILYVLEKGDEDCWWKAKKKAIEVDEEEPVGLVPNNYIEEAESTSLARALYDYTRQTDEEISFTENSELDVFDTSDADWILVGLDGEYGFAPANYIEIRDLKESTPQMLQAVLQNQPTVAVELDQNHMSTVSSQPEIVHQKNISTPVPTTQYMSEASEDEKSPSAPSQVQNSFVRTPDHNKKHLRSISQSQTEEPNESSSQSCIPLQRDADKRDSSYGPQGFHMYNINEMISVMGKRRKMPTTLGINNATGVILIAPEKARDGSEQRWTAEKMTHYSIEGKHVFLEMEQPKKSVDFHAGAKDTAQEIVSALGEIAGAVKAAGLREVIMAGCCSQKKGRIIFDFTAQEENEVTVTAGDEVILISDTKNEAWWQIRRLKDGNEGVVPSSYVEAIEDTSGTIKTTGNTSRSIVEQNRLEEEKLAKDSVRAGKGPRNTEVGPGMRLPERDSSLSRQENSNKHGLQRNKNDRNEMAQLKPDPNKVRTWNDRSKTFSVEAQFLALRDGKINLHKLNGVKIAVPVSKMSIEDLEYVERQTGHSLEDEKPLSGLKKTRSQGIMSSNEATIPLGAVIEKKKEYDWFQFFLECEVSSNICERYSQAFLRDSIDESVLPDIDATVLRTLGIREGDIIKILRYLDKKFSRSVSKRSAGLRSDVTISDSDNQGGLFSGPGGTLKNNTRKTRPPPAVQTNNAINLDGFSRGIKDKYSPELSITPTSPEKDQLKNGFEDDFWDVKPSTQQASSTSNSALGSQPQSDQKYSLSGAMKDLSLLAVPLEPIKLQPKLSSESNQTSQQPSKPSQVVTPSFFAGIGSQQLSLNQQQPGLKNIQLSNKMSEGVIIPSHHQGLNQHFQSQNQGLTISAPNRPLSAPVVNQSSPYTLSSLQPQATGIQTSSGYQQQISQYGQNILDPRVRQVSNGFNGLQSQVNIGGVFSQQGYNQFSNQPPSNLQQNFQQFSVTTGIPQQRFQSSVTSPFSDTHSQQFPPNSVQLGGSFPQQISQSTGINSVLLPPLRPTSATISSHNSFNPSSSAHLHPSPSQLNIMNPLVSQKTGPPPPVRFGVPKPQSKLTPQPTGRRANISQSTPQNPFGF